MNCTEAEVYVSALYDGENVPSNAAQHIADCEACRRILHDYSTIGTDLRLAAAVQPAQLPPLALPPRRNTLPFLWARVAVPRFALVALVACPVVAMVATSVMRAQTRPFWFEFAYGLEQNPQFGYKIAQAGYEDTGAIANFANGSPVGAAVRVQIESIAADDVVLRICAVPPKFEATPTSVKLLAGHKISLDGISSIHYKPGESLSVPIEGGGTLYLKGEIFDHQPKIAFGAPLEPPVGELIMRSPVLTVQGRLVSEMNGATVTDSNENYTTNWVAGSNGTFIFALKPFPGAVEGEANWGEITFKMDGQKYRLIAAAPITGGQQPRPIWVRHDPASPTDIPSTSLGTGRMPE